MNEKRNAQQRYRAMKAPVCVAQNQELEALARDVLELALHHGRKDIVKAVSALLKTIEQTGVAANIEFKKKQWLENFRTQMTNKKRK